MFVVGVNARRCSFSSFGGEGGWRRDICIAMIVIEISSLNFEHRIFSLLIVTDVFSRESDVLVHPSVRLIVCATMLFVGNFISVAAFGELWNIARGFIEMPAAERRHSLGIQGKKNVQVGYTLQVA